jgi:hypothetical protein
MCSATTLSDVKSNWNKTTHSLPTYM